MFNNLIESSSNLKDFKRSGSFLLFTTTTYAVLFAITVLASIYAYDAHLEEQTNELVVDIFVPPAERDPAPKGPVQKLHATRGNENNRVPQREVAMLGP